MAFSKRAPPEDRWAAGRRCTWSPSAGDDDGSATGTDHKVDRGELLGPSGAARLEKWRENMGEKHPMVKNMMNIWWIWWYYGDNMIIWVKYMIMGENGDIYGEYMVNKLLIVVHYGMWGMYTIDIMGAWHKQVAWLGWLKHSSTHRNGDDLTWGWFLIGFTTWYPTVLAIEAWPQEIYPG